MNNLTDDTDFENQVNVGKKIIILITVPSLFILTTIIWYIDNYYSEISELRFGIIIISGVSIIIGATIFGILKLNSRITGDKEID